jgi:hypothetical protein
MTDTMRETLVRQIANARPGHDMREALEAVLRHFESDDSAPIVDGKPFYRRDCTAMGPAALLEKVRAARHKAGRWLAPCVKVYPLRLYLSLTAWRLSFQRGRIAWSRSRRRNHRNLTTEQAHDRHALR